MPTCILSFHIQFLIRTLYHQTFGVVSLCHLLNTTYYYTGIRKYCNPFLYRVHCYVSIVATYVSIRYMQYSVAKFIIVSGQVDFVQSPTLRRDSSKKLT